MNILFGKAETPSDFDELFSCPNSPNDGYFFNLEFGTNNGGLDEVYLTDTVGRGVPVDLESVPNLIRALEAVLEMNEGMAMGIKAKDVALSNVIVTVE